MLGRKGARATQVVQSLRPVRARCRYRVFRLGSGNCREPINRNELKSRNKACKSHVRSTRRMGKFYGAAYSGTLAVQRGNKEGVSIVVVKVIA